MTVRATVCEGQLEAVRKLLADLRRHGPQDDRMPFAALPEVHFARLFVLDDATDVDGEVIPASLVYMADVDGSVDRHLRGLVLRAGAGLDDLFGYCVGWPAFATDRDRLDWLRGHCLRPAAYYVHRVGRTVTQIRDEARLRTEVETLLDRPQAAGQPSADAVRDQVRARVRTRRDLAWALRPAAGLGLADRLRNGVHKVVPAAAALLALPVLLPVAVAGLVAIRLQERTDRPETDLPDPEHVHEVERYEDFAAQNPFTAIGLVKPGPIRRVTMRVALTGLDWGCRHLFARDNLAGVRTIHFARWLPLDDGRRVVFASSYDGSQESYMDDFIDRLSWGVNLVFSNGCGYPRTRWLVSGGARDETAYKRYLRRHQVPTVVFYSAYEALSARNVDDNSLVRDGLRRSGDDADAAGWLGLL
ncbi:MAG: hypothetical protein ACJ73E_02520 [Mycobacteriales bacterium]